MWILGLVVVSLHSAKAQQYPRYNEEEARAYTQYARAAFCTKVPIEEWKCGDMCLGSAVIPGSVRFLGLTKLWKVQGFVARIPEVDKCIVAFRGTVDFQNWIVDGWLKTTPWPLDGELGCEGCRVHSGFAHAYEEIRPAMMAAVVDLSCRNVAFTGHSLGAALATLGSMDLRQRTNFYVGPVYTFGKPRIGNYAFVDEYVALAKKNNVEPPMWRVVHYRDPVPRIAPVGISGYDHEPFEVYYTDQASSTYLECPSSAMLYQPWENATCAYKTNLAECLDLDHIWDLDHLFYLNLSFQKSHMSEACTGTGMAESFLV